jgi:hypothetical protein
MVAAQALHPSQANMIFSARSTGPGRRVDVTPNQAQPAQGRPSLPQQTAHSLRQRAYPKEPASEAGGRVGVGPGLLRRPPSSESHGGAHSSSRLAPMTPTPDVPAMNLPAGARAHSPPTGPGRWPRSGNPSRRGWARRVLGRRGVNPSGACPAPPASPGGRGCQQRSANARWRRLR